jgi:hypothetical protein
MRMYIRGLHLCSVYSKQDYIALNDFMTLGLTFFPFYPNMSSFSSLKN